MTDEDSALADDQQWLDWQRQDVQRILRDRGWTPDEVARLMDALPDEAFQVIRAQAVQEVAEHYIVGGRGTIRIREALAYSAAMMPSATERSDAAYRRRNEALKMLSRRDIP
jgi:SOS response regulatory protein OraA/RecX